MVIGKAMRQELLQLVKAAAEAAKLGQVELMGRLLASIGVRLQHRWATAVQAAQVNGLITITRTL